MIDETQNNFSFDQFHAFCLRQTQQPDINFKAIVEAYFTLFPKQSATFQAHFASHPQMYQTLVGAINALRNDGPPTNESDHSMGWKGRIHIDPCDTGFKRD